MDPEGSAITRLMTVPNALSAFRLAMVPVLIWLACAGRQAFFLGALAASLLSDGVDGFVARRWRLASRFGAQLDTWADLVTYSILPLCGCLLWPEIIKRELGYVVVAVAAYMVPVIAGVIRYGRPPSFHTRGVKAAAVLMAVALALLFTGRAAWPFRVSTVLLALANAEELAMVFLVPEWRPDVPSLFRAARLARHADRGGAAP